MTPVTAGPTLNARDVEKALGLPYWKVMDLLRKGELRGAQPSSQGGEWRVARAEVEKARQRLLARVTTAADANAIAKALRAWLMNEQDAAVAELIEAC